MRLHVVPPPRDLAPYVSLYYRTDVAPGVTADDWVPPEWANLRAGRVRSAYEAAIGDEAMRQVPALVMSGPTSRAARLRISEGSYWGVGLLPLGFAKFLGVPASHYADRFVDMTQEPATAPLQPLFEALLAAPLSMEEAAQRITATLRPMLARPLKQSEAIVAAHAALISDQSRSVSGLAATLGVSTRTLERFCPPVFGFKPQLLLRRQRFLRSLASFMSDPTMKWIDTIDSHYHDQAHFVRDFRGFMGMSPSEYAARPHPITGNAVRARRALRGEAMQLLHKPDRGSPSQG